MPARNNARTALQVAVMFEPNRLAGECLAQAYETLVPLPRRRLGRAETEAQRPTQATRQPAVPRGRAS